jgi:hypothetical protein
MVVVSERGRAARQYAGGEGVALGGEKRASASGWRCGETTGWPAAGRLHGATGWSGDEGRVKSEEGWHLMVKLVTTLLLN